MATQLVPSIGIIPLTGSDSWIVLECSYDLVNFSFGANITGFAEMLAYVHVHTECKVCYL